MVTNIASKKGESSNKSKKTALHHFLLSSLDSFKFPLGWTSLVSSLSSAILFHELHLQKKLTEPPQIFYQDGHAKKLILDERNTAFSKEITPRLYIGTRSILASAMAYCHHGPPETRETFQEVMTMGTDGSAITLDWELPTQTYTSSFDAFQNLFDRKEKILNGPIIDPVVIILHGINNNSKFGYIRSLMRNCTSKGWIGCAVTFRGAGCVGLRTPRGYNAAYTGDLRLIIKSLSKRLKDNIPIFIVGNSLGANVMVKYLGEEGYNRTLPSCVIGAISLGNPLLIQSDKVTSPWAELLALGIKKAFIQNWRTVKEMSCSHFQHTMRKVILARKIGQLDDIISPYLIRNDSLYPFATKIGYQGGQDYWNDASSRNWTQHISIPLLNVYSDDDFLVNNPTLYSIHLENPNLIVVKTKCGGHLGWQENQAHESMEYGSSWADRATISFIDTIIRERNGQKFSKSISGCFHEKNSQINHGKVINLSKRIQSKL